MDSWENTHFGTLTISNASTDFDGDGTPDDHEYLLGKNPNNVNEHFMFCIDLDANNKPVLQWSSQEGMSFPLYKHHDLGADLSEWTQEDIIDTISGGSGQVILPTTDLLLHDKYFIMWKL